MHTKFVEFAQQTLNSLPPVKSGFCKLAKAMFLTALSMIQSHGPRHPPFLLICCALLFRYADCLT